MTNKTMWLAIILAFNVLSTVAIAGSFIKKAKEYQVIESEVEYRFLGENAAPPPLLAICNADDRCIRLSERRVSVNSDYMTALFFAIQTITTTGYGVGFDMVDNLRSLGLLGMLLGTTAWALWTGLLVNLMWQRMTPDPSADTSTSK